MFVPGLNPTHASMKKYLLFQNKNKQRYVRHLPLVLCSLSLGLLIRLTRSLPAKAKPMLLSGMHLCETLLVASFASISSDSRRRINAYFPKTNFW